MRINKQTTIITAIITFTFNSFSQGGIPGIGNTSTLFNFLGFNTIFPSINAPLNIRNDFDNFITLRTAGPTLERMRINHRGPGLVLPGYGPFSMINPYPGNRLTPSHPRLALRNEDV